MEQEMNYLKALMDRFPSVLPEVLTKKAKEALESGDLKDRQLAKLLLGAALEHDPGYSEARIALDGMSECEVHGSIEHMQSATGKCPSCGKH